MKKNVGGIDKMARIGVGLLIIIAGFSYGSLWGLIGVVLLATGLIGFCPAYCPLNFSTADSSCCCGKGSCSEKKVDDEK